MPQTTPLQVCYHVSMIHTSCQNCGGSIRANNKYGYCRQTARCRSLGNWASKKATLGAPSKCKGCGREIRRDNAAGYCTETPMCKSNYRKAKYAQREGGKGGAAAAMRQRDEHPDQAMWSSAKARAAKHGIEFSITREDIRQVWTDTCPIFGYELRINQTGAHGHVRESWSLDRIDNSKGYIPGNIQILSYRANAMKSDATPEELLRFADWIYETYG